MNPNEKLKQIFSPLDLLVIEKEYQYLFPKNKNPDLPDSLYEDAKNYLGTGEYWDRNPAVWRVFSGNSPDPGSEQWKKGILNYYRAVCKPTIVPIDDTRDHISVTVSFEILVINSRQFLEDAFEGVKCATVKTLFGEFPIVEQES